MVLFISRKVGYICIYTPNIVWQVENAKRFCSFSLTLGKPGKHFRSALPEMFSGVYGKKHSRALQLASERECRVFQNILWLEFIYILIQG